MEEIDQSQRETAALEGEGIDIALNPQVRVLIFTTGGTIEKTYDEVDGSLLNRESIIRQNLSQSLRLPYTCVEIHALMSKDSLYMTDPDRAAIAGAIATHATRGHPILVLHGTDTMDQTARYCAAHLPKPGVAVVFTGAMKPLGFVDSDALQNVTEALMVAKVIAPGYYISFHSRLFPAPTTVKSHRHKTFHQIAEPQQASKPAGS